MQFTQSQMIDLGCRYQIDFTPEEKLLQKDQSRYPTKYEKSGENVSKKSHTYCQPIACELQIKPQKSFDGIEAIYIYTDDESIIPNQEYDDLREVDLSKPVTKSFKLVRKDNQSRSLLRVYFQHKSESESFTLALRIPGNNTLRYCYQLLGGGASRSIVASIHNEYDEGRPVYSLYEFIGDARRCLGFEDYVTLLDTLADFNKEFRENLSDTRHRFFKNLILGDSKGSFHRITSVEDYNRKVTFYNTRTDFPEIENETVVQTIIADILDSSSFTDAINGADLTTTALEIMNVSADTISRRDYCLLLSWSVLKNDLQRSRSLIRNRESDDLDGSEYEYYKEIGETADSYAERLNGWEAILPKAAESNSDFKYVLANYLYWFASHAYHKKFDGLIIATYNKAAATLFNDLEIGIFEQFALFYQYKSLYHVHLERDNIEDAISIAWQAAEIAGNASGNWDNTLSNRTVRLLGDALAHRAKNQRSDYREVLETIDTYINAISQLTDVRDEVQEETLAELRGWKYDIMARERMTNQQFESAQKYLNEGIKHFAQANMSGAREMLIIRRYILEAYLAELEGNFEESSNHHHSTASRIEDVFPENESWYRYHTIRAILAEAKAIALGGEYSKAKDRLADIKDKSGYLSYESADLNQVLSAVIDYKEGNLSDLQRHIRELDTSSETNDEYFLSFQNDYTTAFAVIYSAQWLRQHNIETDVENLLDTLVEITLEEAFVISDTEVVEIEALSIDDISETEQWKAVLPAHVLSNLEDVEMRETPDVSDYLSLAKDLLGALELHFEVIAAYYGRIEWDDGWKQKLSETPARGLSIGDLTSFFESIPDDKVGCSDTIVSLMSAPVFDDNNLVELRNKFVHEHYPNLEEDDYNRIKEQVLDVLQNTIRDVPVVATIESRRELNYYALRLHWENIPKQTWLEVDTDLDLNEMYYLPADIVVENATETVSEEQILQCDENRVQTHLSNNR